MNNKELLFCPLGGSGEIGGNMNYMLTEKKITKNG